MLRLMLNQHPNLAVPHETAFITVFYSQIEAYGNLSVRANAVRLLEDISKYHLVIRGGHITDKDAILAHTISTYADVVDAILIEYAKAQGKSRWGDKTPYYTGDIDILWSLFPECKFIHLVRDGRDVIVSQRKISWLSSCVPRLADDWRWKTTICHKVGSVLGPEFFLEIKYEDVIRDTERSLRRICEFLGEEFAPEMALYYQSADQVVPKRSLEWHANSIQQPDTRKLFEWKTKLSIADRIIFEQVAGTTLDLFGYERENLRSSISSKLKNLYYSTIVRW